MEKKRKNRTIVWLNKLRKHGNYSVNITVVVYDHFNLESMGIDPIIVKSVIHNVAKDEGCKAIECFLIEFLRIFFLNYF